MLSFEGKRIDVGANKPKLRRFEIRAFCDKMRSFCTISASTFWKIQPDIYMYIYNRIEQCALPVTIIIIIIIIIIIMALWQLVNLGTRCTVTHCRIALWSDQSVQTGSSERCIMQIVNVPLRDSPPNHKSAQQNVSGA